MGWCSWQRYRCHIICNDATSPECFNERLIKETADAMADGGYKEAGYNYVALDDCWQVGKQARCACACVCVCARERVCVRVRVCVCCQCLWGHM